MTNERGVTLLELLIAMAITTLAMTLVTYFAIDISNFGIDLGNRLETERELDLTLLTLVAEVRSMGPGANGAYSIETATANTFTFYSDTEGDGSFERIRYFVDGTILKKGVIEPTTLVPPTYPAGSEAISEVVHYLTSPSIFQYYDEGYPPEIGPLPSPVNISDIRMVTITGTTDKDTTKSPVATTTSVTVTIRNLRGEI